MLEEDFVICLESARVVNDFQGLPVTAKQTAMTTRKDPILVQYNKSYVGHKQDGRENAQTPISAF